MLTCVVLPIKGRDEVESSLDMLYTLRAEGHTLIDPVIDWMDWAEMYLSESGSRPEICLIV